MAIRLTGFADEAGGDLADQIRAHQELGWDTVEMRMVGDVNFTNLDEEAYAKVKDRLAAAKVGVSCFGSAIANWARPVTGEFGRDVEDLKRAAPRMKELGTQFIRVMSYPNDKKSPLSKADWLKEAARRLKELAAIAEGEGVTLAHENCSGYGGEGPEAMLELFDAVDSPAFKMAFDTGNPPAHSGCREGVSWEFYRAVRERTVHVHVKDARAGGDGGHVFCMPGEGVGDVARITGDLVKTGYDGFMSIEPHIKAQVHLAQQAGKSAGAYEMYVEYGRKMAAILEAARAAAK